MSYFKKKIKELGMNMLSKITIPQSIVNKFQIVKYIYTEYFNRNDY